MDEIKHTATKWAVEILLGSLTIIAVLLRNLLRVKGDSVKVTYEQLSLLIAEKAGQAEKAEEQNAILQQQINVLEKELLFLKSSFYTAQQANIRERVFDAVSKGRARAALSELQMWAVAQDDADLMQEVALLKGQLHGVSERLRTQRMPPEEGRIEKNRINDAILSIARELPNDN